MRSATLSFALGVWWLQMQPELPAPHRLALLGAACVLCLALAAVSRRRLAGRAIGHAAICAAAGIAGFGWAAGFAQLRLADALDPADEGRDIEVVGVIASLPQAYEHGVRFEFEVEGSTAQLPQRLWLAWYRGWREEEWHRPAQVRAGERWRFTVRLKRPHGNLNPHGFDYEAHLLERGLRATGYVRGTAGNRRLDAQVARPDLWIQTLRESIRERFAAALADRPYAGVMVALAIGDQRAIDAPLWQLFNRTGTTHLMSISGLHITMISGLVVLGVGGVWRRIPALALRLPAQKAGIAAGWLAALGYCLLAGFGVPAQRTLYMLSVVALALWAGRGTAPGRVLALALLAVLLLDPWAVLSGGFWLSFGAVAALFYAGAGRLGRAGWLGLWLRTQWAVTIALVPALLALFQQFSLVSPAANLVAIPVVSLAVTPLALLGTVPTLEPLLLLGHWMLAHLMRAIEWLAALPLAVWQQAAPPAWTVLLGLAGCLALLLPRGFPARWVGVLMLLPLIGSEGPRPPPGSARVTVLDVGQGLAVHVQTATRDLIYDTGPQFSPEANSGNRIILPYLRALGVRRLDGLIVSHDDTDHEGGAHSLLEGIAVGWFASSLPSGHPLRASAHAHRPCFAGQRWSWDGVAFEVLHPPPARLETLPRRSNDLSCVVAIDAGGARMLLTGDIESEVEAELVRDFAASLRADVLLVPHHGSRSSSAPAFLAAVAPATAVVSAGYRSRFRHPHPEVTARYEAAGARVLRSDRDGAITIDLGAEGTLTALARERQRRYWHAR
jgi:competence protein ComEC